MSKKTKEKQPKTVDKKYVRVNIGQPFVPLPVGRPTTCTPEIQTKILESIKEIGFEHISYGCVGILDETWVKWKQKAREGVEPYFSFFNQVQAAKAEFQQAILKDLRKGTQHYKTYQWWLEKFDRSRFQPKSSVEVSGPDGSPIEINNKTTLTVDNADQIRAGLLGISDEKEEKDKKSK